MKWPIIDENRDQNVIINQQMCMNATSNDYLGMANHSGLKQCVANAVIKYGVGATGARRLSGNHQLFLDTEQYIANWVGKPAGVLFNSGFQMNSSIFSVLASKSTLIVADKLIHASLIDGIQNSDAQLVRFRHNDMDHLAQVLKKYAHNYSEVIIVCESIYSMDGDTVPIKDMIQLKNEYNAKLIVDEAHSIGLYGVGGNGWINEQGCLSGVDIVLVAFGKAFGLSGGMLLSNQETVATMRAKCRAYIFSTALPLPIAIGIQKSCELIQESDQSRKKLKQNIDALKAVIQTSSNTQIQPIIIGENKEAAQCEQALINAGYFVRAVHHPTVPKGHSRLRITITAQHSVDQISELAQQINNVMMPSRVI